MSTTPSPMVWPTLYARDAPALIRFLVDVVGFRAVADHRSGEHDERVDHAELAWPEGGAVMLGSVKENGQATSPGSLGVYVVTDDPDAVYHRAKEAGAEIVMAPTDTDYGSRDCAFRDPEGNCWNFGTYRGAPVPEG